MAELRRSTRVRKPVQRYNPADDEDELLQAAPPPKRKAKRKAAATEASDEFADENDETNDSTAEGIAAKQSKQKAKSRATAPKATTPAAVATGTAKSKPKTGARYAPTKKIPKLKAGEQETRLQGYVDEPSDKYTTFLERAGKERMFVLERVRDSEPNCHAHYEDCPRESVQLAGSKGNVYSIKISHVPTCNCPQFLYRRGEGLCKHILYVLHHVLKAEEPLAYQTAFLTAELRELFRNAPAMIADAAEQDNKRKPLEDDCPICCMEFETDGSEETVWCRAACGNNLHKSCFDQWARLKGGSVTCPYCRSKWQFKEAPAKRTDSVNKVNMPAQRGATGYYNVRDQLGYDD